jgi:predicted AAA+ superfamily ATPase
MVRAVKFQHVDDATKILENVVAIELLRRREEFYYYFTTSGKEVDFLIKEGLRAKQLIQVSYDMTNPKTREREFRSLLAASKELDCQDLVILTWSQKKTEIVEKKEIQIIPVWEWVMKKV